jgi:hypothetical protein
VAATLSSVVYLIGGLVAVVVLAAAVVVVAVVNGRRRAGASSAGADDAPPVPVVAPMTGLESALAQVTDRDGRPIRDRIDAEAGHVDDLRVPDDTGPVLRRALDHVEHPVARPGAHDGRHQDDTATN